MDNASGVSQHEKEFIQNFAKEAGEWLSVFLPGKPGTFEPVVRQLADKLWEVKILVSNGAAALLPFLPETMQKACADKSRAEIEAFKNKFGEDAKKWPREKGEYFGQENSLIFFVKIGEATGEEIKFTLRFAFEAPGFSVVIKNYGHKVDRKDGEYVWTFGDYDYKPAAPTCSFLCTYIKEWAYSPDVWKIWRDLTIESMVDEIQSEMAFTLGEYNFDWYIASVPKKCFAYVFWMNMDYMGWPTSKKVEAAWDRIRYSWGEGSDLPVMMVKFEIGKIGEGLKVTGYMPMPYDPVMFFDFGKFLEQFEHTETVFEMIIQDKEFASVEIMDRIAEGGASGFDWSGEICKKIIEEYGLR